MQVHIIHVDTAEGEDDCLTRLSEITSRLMQHDANKLLRVICCIMIRDNNSKYVWCSAIEKWHAMKYTHIP